VSGERRLAKRKAKRQNQSASSIEAPRQSVRRCRLRRVTSHGLRRLTTGSALPKLPQSVPRGLLISWLHWFASATACQVARPPVRIRLDRPAFGDFYFQAFNGSVSLSVAGYNYNNGWISLCWRDLHPLEWQLASLHGQTEKNSVRAYVFRFTLELGHCSMHSACLKGAIFRRMHRSKANPIRLLRPRGRAPMPADRGRAPWRFSD
jgi:hypothetical protein